MRYKIGISECAQGIIGDGPALSRPTGFCPARGFSCCGRSLGMLTCKSPRKVMLVAHRLAARALPRYSSRFSRHDLTLPPLFACLVVMEHQRRSYRGAEALLRDGRHWCRAIGMRRTPDHNTLWRAASLLLGKCKVRRLMDAVARWAATARMLGL